MTSFAAILALMPILVTGNQPGQEIEFPMAIVITGGLITSLLITLFCLPVAYLHFGKRDSSNS